MEARAGSATRRIGPLSVIAAVLVPLAAACGGSGSAGPEGGVSVADIQHEQYFYEGEYLGRTVTVTAAVSDVRGPRSFELSGGGYGEGTLLVVTSEPVEVEKGEVVRVTGTVGQFHISAPSEEVPYIQHDLYSKHETHSYLYDATVEGT